MNKFCEKVFKRLDETEEKYLDFWRDICRIESPTLYKEGVDRVVDYIVERAVKRGWSVEWCKQAIGGNAACVTMNPNAKGKPVCLSAHADTVHPVGLFGEKVVWDDGEVLHGPGVMDCKGGLASSFYAMAALEDMGYVDRPIKLIIQSDEEVSSTVSNKETIAFMCECAKGAEFFLNLEGYAENKVVVARKGIIRYTVKVKGVAAHSSICFSGVSAVREAAHKIIELEKIQTREGLSFNCGMIKGGTADNTVPEECEFTVDIRFSTKEEMQYAEKRVMEIVEHSYIGSTTAEATLKSSRPPMELTQTNLDFVERLNSIFVECGFERHEGEKETGGSDAAYITEIGVPCVDNLGTRGEYVHSVREYAYLDSLKHSAKLIASAIICY